MGFFRLCVFTHIYVQLLIVFKYKVLILYFQSDESSNESTGICDKMTSTGEHETYSSICKSFEEKPLMVIIKVCYHLGDISYCIFKVFKSSFKT